jgi:protein-tyrosine-phosphatase
VSGILLICHANTCRSVMAQALLEKMLAERGVNGGIPVRSAGVSPYARDGMLASLDARIVLREVGIHLTEESITSTDLRSHRDLLSDSHLVVTMTADQREVVGTFPEAAGRTIVTLRELAGETGDIKDPVGQGEDRYRACRDEIARCLEQSMDRLLAPPAGRSG